jgi:two-component system chemotaxis response regulator CheB
LIVSPIRVLVVDDSVVIRRLLRDVLSADPLIEVVGTASNGHIALAKVTQLSPDLVVLDVEMPELDGLATLRALRASHPQLPVIMFSSATARGAAVTIEALLLGANDYVTKPSNVGSLGMAIDRVREELVPKVKALCGAPSGLPPSPVPSRPGSAAARPALPPSRIDVVAIGVSTGGPTALAQVLSSLPGDLPVPAVIVQHMPPVFTRYLAERLDAQCALRVSEAGGGEALEPGHVWIAPGDSHLVVHRLDGRVGLRTHQGPPENSCRPAVDVLFRSVAETFGPHAIGVVLTGMGYDGRRGCESIRAAGGQVLAQDEASSVVWGMPGAVVAAGLADVVVPLDRIASEVTRRVGERSRGR